MRAYIVTIDNDKNAFDWLWFPRWVELLLPSLCVHCFYSTIRRKGVAPRLLLQILNDQLTSCSPHQHISKYSLISACSGHDQDPLWSVKYSKRNKSLLKIYIVVLSVSRLRIHQIYISVTFCIVWKWVCKKWLPNVLSTSKLYTTMTSVTLWKLLT